MTTARLPKAEKTFLSEVLLALEETEEQRDIRLQKLFGFFDSSRKGYLDHRDVEVGFKALSIPCQYTYVNDLLEVCDSNSDGRVDFTEFCRYMDDKELELYNIFKEIDVRHNGSILPDELRSALLHSGIKISDDEFMHFVERVDKDKNGEITFKEWRDFLFLYPHKATITNIYQYWEKVYLVDIGEHAIIPEGISRHSHAAKYFIAGGVAGALSRTATAPLDRVKVLFQIKKGTQSFVPCALKIYKESGFSGFFRGNGVNILKVAPESAIKFYAYETVKGLLVQLHGSGSKDDISGIERLLAGGTAGAIAQTTIYPMELIKTRLMTHDHAPSLSKLSKEIWRQEGFRAFYRGLLPSLLGIVPYAGIDLAAYESLKNRSRQWLSNDRDPGPLIHLGCGMVSGAVGATSVYPLQVIRTRLQADSSNRYKGMIHAIQTTWREEGIRAFYKGLLPSLFKVVPSASITYIAYEEMKKYLSI